MDFEADDILPRAAPFSCAALTSEPHIRELVGDIGPWMPQLRTCPDFDRLVATVAEHRPDIVILGGLHDPCDIAKLAGQVRTATLGLAVMDDDVRRCDALEAVLNGKPPPRIDLEPIRPGTGAAEAVLRLRALLRRCRPLSLNQRRSVGDLVLDEGALRIEAGPRSAALGVDGFRVIGPFFDLPDHVWCPEDLLSVAYGARSTNNPRSVEAKLNVTRRKLRDALGRDPVRTIRKLGYRLAPTL
jgi:hypothetical protein